MKFSLTKAVRFHKSTRRPDFRARGYDLCLTNQYTPLWVDLRPASLGLKVSIGVRGQEGSCSVGFCRSLDELQTLCRGGQLDKALDFLVHLEEQGIIPTVKAYLSLLNACTKKKALVQAKRVHAHLAHNGLQSVTSIGESLVTTLVKCGGLHDAVEVFHTLPERTVFSWTALVSGYTFAGQSQRALKMYLRMQEEGVEPNKYTFVSLLKACGSISNLEVCKRMHGEVVRFRLENDVFVGSCLVDMYGKCGSTVDARHVFDGLCERDVVLWNSMMAAYAQQGQGEKTLELYEQMLEEGVSPDHRTFVSALQACCMVADSEVDDHQLEALEMGKAIHSGAVSKGCDSDIFVGSTLIRMYGRCGSIMDAQNAFDGLSQQNVVSWTVLLAAYVQQGDGGKVLHLYEEMRNEGVSPNSRTFVTLLQACSMLAEREGYTLDEQHTAVVTLQKGKAIHADARRKGCDSESFVANTLISMYGKCASLVDAQNVFDGLAARDLVSWNVMLAACTQQDEAAKALQLYEQMWREGVSPNSRTFVSALQACGMLADKEEAVLDGQYVKVSSLKRGRRIHADARRKHYDSDVFVGNTLVSMYGRCGSIRDAHDVFDRLSHRSVVAWTAMLSAYVKGGQGDKALQLYEQMQVQGVSPDELTLMSIVQACIDAGSLHICRQIHHSVLAAGHELSPLLATTLIHTYGRCSSMMEAQNVFDSLQQANVVSWNALLAGFARQGDSAAILECYEKMRLAGTSPNGITFLSLLSVCSHAGFVHRGLQFFESMSRDFGIAPRIEHFVCMVDLLGRAGHFTTIELLLSTMPVQPDLALWSCLLGACQKHGKVLLGKRAFDGAVHLQPKHASAYLLMFNIYADAGLWDHAQEVQELMQKAGASKKPGQSWAEHEQEVRTFMVGDRTCTKQEHVYDLLEKVSSELRRMRTNSGESRKGSCSMALSLTPICIL